MKHRLDPQLINSYSKRLKKLSKATQAVVRQVLQGIEYDSVAELREILIERLEPVLGVSTDVAAAYAAEFYDEVRRDSIGESLGANADSQRIPAATEGFIRAVVGQAEDGGLESIIPVIESRASYEINRAAGECVFYNGIADPRNVRFARVPTGVETCPFCIMLASRGFVYRSAMTAGEDGHYHAHCDCRIVPSFKETEIPGYDPDKYFDQYLEDLKSGKLKLNNNSKTRVRRSGSNAQKSNGFNAAFDSFGDIQKFINGSSDMVDLQKRCEYVESKWHTMHLSDKYWKDLIQHVNSVKSELRN